jgi:NAD(P)H-dependent FMN reductase
MTTRIAYYSWQGHTEKVATALARLLNAELVPIEPVNNCRVGREALKAFFGVRSQIRPADADLAGIDTLVIACPVWAGKVPPYINTYLDSVTNGSGKPFHVLVEMGGRGDTSAIAVVRTALERKGMTFVSSASTIEKDVDSGSFTTTLETFAAGIRN